MKKTDEKIINANHLKKRIQTKFTGDWYSIYTMMALVDSEPPVNHSIHFVASTNRQKVGDEKVAAAIGFFAGTVVTVAIIWICLWIGF